MNTKDLIQISKLNKYYTKPGRLRKYINKVNKFHACIALLGRQRIEAGKCVVLISS